TRGNINGASNTIIPTLLSSSATTLTQSKVWNYFTRIQGKTSLQAKCTLYPVDKGILQTKFSTTTTLKQYLKQIHDIDITNSTMINPKRKISLLSTKGKSRLDGFINNSNRKKWMIFQ
ncbi:unnamed protein product, partial [Didymodactylos carnosus]